MKNLWALLVCCVMFGLLVQKAPAAEPKPPVKRVLFFSKSSAWEHDAIKLKMENGDRGYAFPVLEQIGAANAIEFTFSKDGSLFTPDYLAKFDAFVFYTSGDLTEVGTDQNPAMTAEGKQALLDAVANGKGFVGIHGASDTFHSGAGKEQGPARFQSDGDNADPFIKMLGGEFMQHGKQQESKSIVIDGSFPGANAVADGSALTEEWYSYKNFAPDLHVIVATNTEGMTGFEYARYPYPQTWARMHGKGRVFYTGLGHREDVWTNTVFQSLVTGGLNWALGRVDADVAPNLLRSTPNANELPKYVAPAK